MIQYRILIIFALLLPGGCQLLNSQVDFDSPNSKPPVGTILKLNQPLSFYPGSSRSYIQDGRAKTFKDIDERSPWCQFYRYEPPAALQTVRTVEPDSFRVISSTQSMELVGIHPELKFTAGLILPDMYDDDTHEKTLSTVMKVKSEKQPEIVEFKCAVFNDPFRQNFVSVHQIQQTLGEVVTMLFN